MTYAWFTVTFDFYGGQSPLDENDIEQALAEKMVRKHGAIKTEELECDIEVKRKISRWSD